MADTTGISWCDATINFWIGCTRTSPACDFCYAADMAKRRKWVTWGPGEPRMKTKGAIDAAFRLQRKAKRERRQIRIFSNSLADMFDAEVDDEWRDEAIAVMALTPDLDWLVLTKRPNVATKYFHGIPGCSDEPAARDALIEGSAQRVWQEQTGEDPSMWLAVHWPLPNVWLGVTAETQTFADQRIPILLRAPAAKRFVSVEPLLGPIDLTKIVTYEDRARRDGRWALMLNALTGYRATSPYSGIDGPSLDLVVTGGESGPRARPSHPDWFRQVRDQCVAAGVPFHHKQNGMFHPQPLVGKADGCFIGDRWSDEIPWNPGGHPEGVTCMARVGTKRSGRLLDGKLWNQMPDGER